MVVMRRFIKKVNLTNKERETRPSRRTINHLIQNRYELLLLRWLLNFPNTSRRNKEISRKRKLLGPRSICLHSTKPRQLLLIQIPRQLSIRLAKE